MALYKPTMYKKNIFEIDYEQLKKKGIRCLVFDLDNTLGLIDEEKCPKEAKKLLKKLKKDFTRDAERDLLIHSVNELMKECEDIELLHIIYILLLKQSEESSH